MPALALCHCLVPWEWLFQSPHCPGCWSLSSRWQQKQSVPGHGPLNHRPYPLLVWWQVPVLFHFWAGSNVLRKSEPAPDPENGPWVPWQLWWFTSSWPVITPEVAIRLTWLIRNEPGCWRLLGKTFFFNKRWCCPDWYGSVGWALSQEVKVCWFDSWSGHMPGLWVKGHCERQPTNVPLSHWCFSPSLSLSLPLSQKINKIFKKKKRML